MTVDMKKMFFEKNTGRYATTLAEAMRSAFMEDKSPYVCRVWLDGGKEIGRSPIFAYGVRVSTIKNADAYIAIQVKEVQK